MNRSDTSFAALLLTQRLFETPAAPLKASEYWTLLDAVADPAVLLGLDASGVGRTAGIEPRLAERVVRLLEAATVVAFMLDEQSQSGVRVLASVDEEYPAALMDRLGRAAPPLLYAVGDVSLLQTSPLGIVGGRNIEQAGADVAKQAAIDAVKHSLGVVSGGARGVDRLAMNAALESAGNVVGVLADSLARTTREPDVRRAVTDGRLCLCTPFKPTAGFTVAGAMGRNKLIYALSAATLVVAAEADKGGTWAGAVEAIKQRIAPVLVWMGDGAGSGNERLVGLGATPVDTLDGIYPLPSAGRRDNAAASQLVLDIAAPSAQGQRD